MEIKIPGRIAIIFLILVTAAKAMGQESPKRMILDDGTAVKIYSNGDVELRFPDNKQISSAFISSDGEVTTEYQKQEEETGEKPANVEGSENKELVTPSTGIFSVDLDQLDDSSRQTFIKARIHYLNYFSEGYQHRQNVFRWQLLSSKIIFVIVALLVFSGIVFAGIQFYAGYKSTLQPEQEMTTFEAGKGGVKVSSPILGVIILVISLVFFYLYLVYVYPIEEIF